MNRLATWLHTCAQRHPEALALLAAEGRWTYRELAKQAHKGAAYLYENGLRSGDLLAMAGTASELALAALACSAADIALLPLDPLTAEARWPELQRLAGRRARRLPPLPRELPATDRPWQEHTASEHLALVIATSGSEGRPKAVMLTTANLASAAAASNERLPLAAGDSWLGCLPLHHIGGMAILYRCLRAGATLLLHEKFDATNVWRDLQAHPARPPLTHISLVPAMLARLLDAADGAPPPASLRHALIGGGALSRPLVERARNTGWPICPTWGMSECAAQVATLLQIDDSWQEGDVGTLLPGFAARIDAEGRIHLRGPQVMAGYLNAERKPGVGLDAGLDTGLGEDRQNGWLITADLGRIDAAGRLTILGRADDVFNSGGVKVHPLEVESCLAACPGVADVAVTALPDPIWGDMLIALLVGNAAPEQIERWSRQHLSPAQRPRQLLKVEHLPRNAMGKIERSALRSIARHAGNSYTERAG